MAIFNIQISINDNELKLANMNQKMLIYDIMNILADYSNKNGFYTLDAITTFDDDNFVS